MISLSSFENVFSGREYNFCELATDTFTESANPN